MFKIILIALALYSVNTHAEEMVVEILSLNNRSASEIQSLISPLLEESETLIANGSRLIIKATPTRQKELKNLLSKLDKPLVNLTITVVQTKTKTAEELNASASIGFNNSKHRPSPSAINASSYFTQTDKKNSTDRTQVISTVEGKSAYIKTASTHPVQNITVHDSGYGFPTVSGNTQLIETSTGFLVTPRLIGEQVEIEIKPWSEKMNSNGNINSYSASSAMKIDLGEWKEMGGIREQSQRSTNKRLSHSYSTANKSMRILIKVEKTH